jgi:hypothetical protein
MPANRQPTLWGDRMDEIGEAIEQYPILRYFEFGHLPPRLGDISAPFCELAYDVANNLPHNPETSTALRKLLEAKDAAVRALV